MGVERSFEDVIDTHREHIEQLLPVDQDIDTQLPAMRTWYEEFDPDDVVWCIGEAAGAYGLLAADRLGPDRVVVFEADASRLSAVRAAFGRAGLSEISVEPATVLGWQTSGGRASESPTADSDDPVSAVLEASETPGRPTALLLDLPGYGGDVHSTLDGIQHPGLRSVLVKTTGTLAQSHLEAEGFETTEVATRTDARGPWSRALWASRVTGGEGQEAAKTDDGAAAQPDRHWIWHTLQQLLDTTFNPLQNPWRMIEAKVVAVLFVLFVVGMIILVELAEVLGFSRRLAAAVAGALVVAIPILGTLAYLYMAISVPTDDDRP